MKRISAIFTDPPNVWGLKGEPQLWEEFKTHFTDRNTPPTEEKFLEELYDTFEKLTGRSVESDRFIFVKRYYRGGITSGLVDPWNWRAVVIPALTRRFREHKDTN